jgi:hypothetical protein
MRRYSIKRVAGAVKFSCDACEFYVLTTEFDAEKGHLRTQAAKVMNEHIAREHRLVRFKPLLDPRI